MAYLEGTLGEDERTDLERHLGACGRCRDLVREVAGVHRTLRAAGSRASWEGVSDGGRTLARRRGGGPRGARRECPGEDELAAYADGSLAGRRAARIEEHVARCAACLAEVADLMSMAAAPEREPPARAVEAALARIDRDRRTAIVRIADRSVVLVRDFVRAGLPERAAPLRPAFATARSARAPVRLHWSDEGGLDVECEVRRTAEGATLTGRVTSGGRPSLATSVTLTSGSASRGPESLDPRGRFGPWPLSGGTSRLAVTSGDGGIVELSIELRTGAEEAAAA